jgi:hypothetical protein
MTAPGSNVHAMPSRDRLTEARGILAEAGRRDVVLRLMGGVGILARCPSAARPPLAREYGDIDFFGRSRDSAALISVLTDLGYAPEPRFNALHGHRRLLFKAAGGEHRDVLLDRFEMCHTLDLADRLELDAETLPLADLLLTKLQVVQANAKDHTDALALLVDHRVGDDPEVIDAGYIARLCAADWGLFRTITASCERVAAHADQLDLDERDAVRRRVAALLSRVEQEPKTRRWKLRAKVGERVRWYELPEEVG